ncbi:MAG: hypothetical protein JXR51_11405 [Bacteroidales bacterium]|nr:hypothetical protein [Bacteroidales bacterium]MBN2757776.1 hypothetical protein [Bacteroidales bacterium]
MKTIYVLFLISLILISCKNQSNEQAGKNSNGTTKNVIHANPFLISAKGVGAFDVNDKFPDLNDSTYEKKDTLIFKEGDEFFYRSIYQMDTLRLVISLSPNDSIYDITILSPKYKNNQGLGVGCKLSQILTVYNDFEIFYSYVSGNFVVYSKQIENLQFIIDSNAYKGDKKKLNNSDIIILKHEDFIEDAEITKIRIF